MKGRAICEKERETETRRPYEQRKRKRKRDTLSLESNEILKSATMLHWSQHLKPAGLFLASDLISHTGTQCIQYIDADTRLVSIYMLPKEVYKSQ